MIRTLLKDERGQIEVLLLLLLLLFLVGVALFGGAIVAILLLTPIALFLFIWRRVFPFARSIAEWTTNRVNFFPFVLFMLLLLTITGILMVMWFVLYAQTGSAIFFLLGLLLLPIHGLALLINGVALGLAITLWLIRLNHHMFDRFRTRFLTVAFGMVMRRAERKQEKAAMPPKAKRRWRVKRRQNKANNPQKKANNPQSRADNPHSRPKKRQ